MNQLRVLLLLVFFLHSKVGVAFNIHYCGGHIANISWVFDAKNCDMETTIDHTIDNQHGDFFSKMCCDDEEVIEQNTSGQSKIEMQNRVIKSSLNVASTFFVYVHRITNKPLIQYAGNAPPKEQFYLQFCSFIFYG